MKNRTRRVYITKKIRTQYLYWKILIATFVVAVCGLGAVDQYTQRYIARLTPSISKVHHFIQVAHAETLPAVVQTKSAYAGESVEQMIRRIAKEENFKWPDYAVKLAKCESRLNPKAVNIHGNNPSTSRDVGLYQINNFWHKEVSEAQALDPDFSTRWMMKMVNSGHQNQWVCNRIILKK